MGLRTKRKTENASPGPCTGALCPLAGLASCCCRAVESFATTVIYRNSCLSHTYTNLPSFTWRVWVVHESLIFLLLYYTKQDLTMQRFMSFTCIRQMQENHRSLVVLPHRAQTMYISQTKYTGTHMHAPSVRTGSAPSFLQHELIKAQLEFGRMAFGSESVAALTVVVGFLLSYLVAGVDYFEVRLNKVAPPVSPLATAPPPPSSFRCWSFPATDPDLARAGFDSCIPPVDRAYSRVDLISGTVSWTLVWLFRRLCRC
jgi:hypothetical protein